jgi:ribosomal protein S18 acetylase RimI-like enzyme
MSDFNDISPLTDAPPVTWREAKTRDAPRLLEMMREFYAADAMQFEEGRAGRALATLMGDPSLGRVWLIESGGEPAGYIVLAFSYSLEFGGRDAFVDELYVRPGFERRGLGRATLAFVEREARSSGAYTLLLEVRTGNKRARRLYERAGFAGRQNALLAKKLE